MRWWTPAQSVSFRNMRPALPKPGCGGRSAWTTCSQVTCSWSLGWLEIVTQRLGSLKNEDALGRSDLPGAMNRAGHTVPPKSIRCGSTRCTHLRTSTSFRRRLCGPTSGGRPGEAVAAARQAPSLVLLRGFRMALSKVSRSHIVRNLVLTSDVPNFFE